MQHSRQDENIPTSMPPSPSEHSVEMEAFQDRAEIAAVADDEVIYRSVQLIPQFFRWGAGDEIRVSASAFNDRSYEPSFFRGKLCENPPYQKPPRMNPDDAVAHILVETIRHQNAIPFQSGTASQPTEHKVNVRPETGGHHQAHVVVFAAPEFKTKGGFARLKELLAQIVGGNWAIPPSDAFLEQHQEQIPKK